MARRYALYNLCRPPLYVKPWLLRGAHTGNPFTLCVSFSSYSVGVKIAGKGSLLYGEDYDRHGYVSLPGSTPRMFPPTAPMQPNTVKVYAPHYFLFSLIVHRYN